MVCRVAGEPHEHHVDRWDDPVTQQQKICAIFLLPLSKYLNPEHFLYKESLVYHIMCILLTLSEDGMWWAPGSFGTVEG